MIPQPKLEIRVPIVRLQLADLTFLRSLCGEQPTCEPTYKQKDRLKLLGLVEDKEFPPCPQKQAAQDRVFAETYAKAKAAWAKKDWPQLRNYTYTLANSGKLSSVKKLVITKDGLEILRKGGVTVKMRKEGCA